MRRHGPPTGAIVVGFVHRLAPRVRRPQREDVLLDVACRVGFAGSDWVGCA